MTPANFPVYWFGSGTADEIGALVTVALVAVLVIQVVAAAAGEKLAGLAFTTRVSIVPLLGIFTIAICARLLGVT